MDNNKVWFITGASKGFGLSLVKQLLDAGQLVAATSRNLQELTNAVNTTSNNFLPYRSIWQTKAAYHWLYSIPMSFLAA
jgi:NAD(P)-dependent dehydrogenase (short-subunit alcohol dehydrogenase family)